MSTGHLLSLPLLGRAWSVVERNELITKIEGRSGGVCHRKFCEADDLKKE
jgi:hypothetical protein